MMLKFCSAAISRAALAALACVMAAPGQAAPPSKLEVTYEVTWKGIVIAEVVEKLEHGGGKYEITENSEGRGLLALKGSMRRSSRGLVTNDGLRPVEFVDERTGRETSRARFDWSANTLTMQFREGPEVKPIPPNAQDRLSFVLNFAFAPLGSEPVQMSVADGGSISRYTFAVVGQERIKVPAGEFDTVKVARVKDGPEDKRSSEMWLAPSLGYVPVRLLATEKNGMQVDQVATKISGR
jgi:hypothetical protein